MGSHTILRISTQLVLFLITLAILRLHPLRTIKALYTLKALLSTLVSLDANKCEPHKYVPLQIWFQSADKNQGMQSVPCSEAEM